MKGKIGAGQEKEVRKWERGSELDSVGLEISGEAKGYIVEM